ncbi:MAG: DUF262 domain-containing protein [Candidatus Dormibacteraeota bacterium]|jgi:alkylated DNA nucleotide flippase Atl1|nr:DUF262 domain-containing protein [Candidatus Dormibacteraeota bacterium]
MKAGPTTLKPLIEGQKQYRVPIFQRPYTWEGAQLKQLWADILAQYELLQAEQQGSSWPKRSRHFLGSFVLAPIPTGPSSVSPYLVIDGQQRLITLFLALAALRDLESARDPGARAKYDGLYLKNEYATGLDQYKVLPAKADREAFFACMDSEPAIASTSKIAASFAFLQQSLRAGPPLADGGKDTGFDLELISQVIVDRLAVVEITTEADDNPYAIFASLNGTGVGLTQADLLRNYIFMLLPRSGEDIHAKIWRPMEDLLRTQENLEGLARVDLQRRGIDVTRDEVYRRHQERLEPLAGHEDQVAEQVRELAHQACFYARLVDPGREPDLEVRRSLRRLNRWGAQTTYPLIMQLFTLQDAGKCQADDLRLALSYLESFIVRRFLCQVPANQLNRLFIELVKDVDGATPVRDAVRAGLSGARRYWPTDEQVRAAVLSRPFYLMGRADQRRLILERLEESCNHKEPVSLEGAKLSVEHVLPQTLTPDWRQALRELDEDPDGLFAELGHTLGNLTLTGYNPELGNSSFEQKRAIYADSHLELTRAIAKSERWGREEIEKRGAQLADRVISIWPGPLPGSKGVVFGFDWSRIDAAVRAIPAGRWTSYGDLAALGQTHPQPVGTHLASSWVENAHRVLDNQGRVAAGFHWLDPADGRDVRVVLQNEGLEFTPDGSAAPPQHLDGYDLAKLIPYELDPEELVALQLRFKSGAVPSDGQGKLWTDDGRSWHLNRLRSDGARERLLELVSFVTSCADGIGDPDWAQQRYLAWKDDRGRTWARAHPKEAYVWFQLWGSSFTGAELAEQLGYEYLPAGGKPNTGNDGSSQVRDLADEGGLSIQLRHVADLAGARGEVLRAAVRNAWVAAQTAPGPSGPIEGAGYGRAWHLGQLTTQESRQLLEGLVELVESCAAEIGRADWGGKAYVGWKDRSGHLRAYVRPHQGWMTLVLRSSYPKPEEVAERLGYPLVPAGSLPDTSHDGRSQVGTHGQGDGVYVQFRQHADLSGAKGEALRAVVREAFSGTNPT